MSELIIINYDLITLKSDNIPTPKVNKTLSFTEEIEKPRKSITNKKDDLSTPSPNKSDISTPSPKKSDIPIPPSSKYAFNLPSSLLKKSINLPTKLDWCCYLHVLIPQVAVEEGKAYLKPNEDNTVSLYDIGKGIWNTIEFTYCYNNKNKKLLNREIDLYIDHMSNGNTINLFAFGVPHSDKNHLLFDSKMSFDDKEFNYSIKGFDERIIQSLLSYVKKDDKHNSLYISVVHACNEDIFDLVTNKSIRIRYSNNDVNIPDINKQEIKNITDYNKYMKIIDINYNSHIIPNSINYFILSIILRKANDHNKITESKLNIINCPVQDPKNMKLVKSLSSIKDLLLSIKQKSKVIPYRTNKITMLMKNYITPLSIINIVTFVNTYNPQFYNDIKSAITLLSSFYLPYIPKSTKKSPQKTSPIKK